MTNQQLSAGQCLAILAAVDWEGTKDEVEFYVGEWEAGVPVDSFYETDPDENSDPEAITPKQRLRLLAPARPHQDSSPTSTPTTPTKSARRPETPVSSESSDEGEEDDDDASMLAATNEDPPSTGAPNFYNADKDTHIFVDVDPDNAIPESLLAENCLPLEPPSYLSDKQVTAYERLMERTYLFSSLRPLTLPSLAADH